MCATHRSIKWRMENPEKHAYNNLRHHARQRGKEFTITFAYFVRVVGMQSYIDGKGVKKHCLHIDRIDETLGYVPGNIQIMTNINNVLKSHEHRRKVLAGVPEKVLAAQASKHHDSGDWEDNEDPF